MYSIEDHPTKIRERYEYRGALSLHIFREVLGGSIEIWSHPERAIFGRAGNARPTRSLCASDHCLGFTMFRHD